MVRAGLAISWTEDGNLRPKCKYLRAPALKTERLRPKYKCNNTRVDARV